MASNCLQCGFQASGLVERCPQCGNALTLSASPAWFAEQAAAAPISAAKTVAMRGLPEVIGAAPGGAEPGGPGPAAAAPVEAPRRNPHATVALTRAELGIFAEQDSAGQAGPTLDGPGSIDMRQVLEQASPRPPGGGALPQTMAFVPPGSPLDETSVEGLEPVKLRGRRVVSVTGRKRQLMSRSLPLVLVASVALLALAVAGWGIARSDARNAAAGPTAGPRVTLPAGEFTIGLTEENKDSVLSACYRLSDNPNHECRRAHLQDLGEYPAREVGFPELVFDRDEVSNRGWAACVADGACPERALAECRFYTHRGYQLNATVPERMLWPDMPASCVTREEAEAYCRWAGGRLPTAAEWERAARNGDDRLSPWGELWAPHLMNWGEHDMAAFPVVGRLDGYDLTAPVDHFGDGETPDGIRNLFGNVAEWVATSEGVEDGVRGGSYTNDLRDFRATFHEPMRPDSRRSNIGFRCVY